MTLSRAKSLFYRSARLGLYGLALGCLSTWWFARQASAELSERSLALGDHLGKLGDLIAGTTSIELNGQPLTLTSASTEHDVTTVLDRFTGACIRESGGTSRELEALLADGARLPSELKAHNLGVMRAQEENRKGTAACFARTGDGGFKDLFTRIGRFAETGNFGELGELRYVTARRGEDSSSTHVIAVAARGTIPLEKMFPEEGDAPGTDLFPGVRPAASRRVISAQVSGRKHHAVIYQTTRPPAEVLRDFDAPLEARGFAVADLSVVENMNPVPTRVYLKEDDLILVLGDEASGTVAAYRLPSGGFVRMKMP